MALARYSARALHEHASCQSRKRTRRARHDYHFAATPHRHASHHVLSLKARHLFKPAMLMRPSFVMYTCNMSPPGLTAGVN